MVGKAKIRQCHLPTEVVVEAEDELGNIYIIKKVIEILKNMRVYI